MRKAALAFLTTLIAGACGDPGATMTTPEAPHTAATTKATAAGGAFKSVAFHGDGCSGADATADISPDGQAFTALFSKFLVQVEEDAATRKASIGCLLEVTVDVPAGWEYAIDNVDQRGFASLGEDASATRRGAYFVADRAALPAPSQLRGPSEDSFQHGDIRPDQPLWSGCGKSAPLFVATTLDVDASKNAGAGATLTVDSIDGQLAWRECN